MKLCIPYLEVIHIIRYIFGGDPYALMLGIGKEGIEMKKEYMHWKQSLTSNVFKNWESFSVNFKGPL